ncbi:hypothetical protein IPZ69_42470 [Streptomyces olivochromogenes]|nr:hypothetical protein [Streptomyces olivochromogenes]
MREVPEPLLPVLAEGWMLGYRGAQLLGALSSGYRPDDPDGFVDVVQFESAVNGRGMTDWDLPRDGRERGVRLLRRSLSYACAALRAVPESFAWPVFGYVSLSCGGLEDDILTANVTFCTKREGVLPYVDDIESFAHEALLEISQEDAMKLMPRGDHESH